MTTQFNRLLHKHSLLHAAILLCASVAMGCQPNNVRSDVAATQQSSTAKQAHVRDIRDDVFYFVLPDRFNNANPDNDNGAEDLPISNGGLDISSKWAFHGGDMQGIEEKLDYLQNLGVTAIWMTPILRNQATQLTGFAHHGYWILDFTQIDPHFGSNDDLRSLIDAAHQRGMKIFFDIITNHTADIIRYEECHKADGTFKDGLNGCDYKSTQQLAEGDTYTPFIPAGLETVKTPAWLNDPKYYHNQGDSFWQGESALNGDFVGLDDLKTSDPEVVQGMIEIYQNIISEFKPDGFRIDTVKHVDLSFWQEFSPAIMSHAKQLGLEHFTIFGEVYDGNPAVLSRYTTIGDMPSVLDFGMQYAAADAFYRDKSVDTVKRLIDNDDYYNDADSDATLLMNFLGNHDMGRAAMFLQQAQPDAGEQELLQRLLLSNAFMFTSRGVPVIYYGDEQGFTGDGGDVDARENMFPSQVASYNDNTLIGTSATTADNNFDLGHPLYQGLAELAKLRQEHRTLRYGQQQMRTLDTSGADQASHLIAFSRFIPAELTDYLVIFNPTATTTSAQLRTDTDYQAVVAPSALQQQANNVNVELAPFSYTVLKSSKPIQQAIPTAVSLQQQKADNQRIHFKYQIEYEHATDLPAVAVETYLLDEHNNSTLASIDYTVPYQAIIPPQRLANTQRVKVVVKTNSGKQVETEFALKRELLEQSE